MEKNSKKWVKVGKKLLKRLVRDVVCFIIGLVAIITRLMVYVYKLMAKFFRKLPDLIKAIVIFAMITLSVLSVEAMANKTTIVEKKEEVIKINFTEGDAKVLREENVSLREEIERLKAENQKERTIKSLGEIGTDIYNKAVEKGLTHEQAVLVVSISRHETGNWVSNAFINKNNFGGVMCSTGLKTYETYNDGLDSFVSLLKNRYFDKGLDTIEKIGDVYCPIGASNDPTGVNKHWIPNVTKYYNEYLSK